MARVAKRKAHVVIAHLMSRAEIKKHHGSNSSVAGDELPDRPEMRRIFLEAGLNDLEIRDEPGRYLARALKI